MSLSALGVTACIRGWMLAWRVLDLPEEFLSQGESPRDASLPVVEHAAWAQVAALLLNLSETVTRN